MAWLGWLGAFVAISLLIIVHEAGHYFVAKWCKMRVERFSLGFGPALLSWKRNETRFQLAPILFGGFVEIQGMNIAEDVDPRDRYAYPNRPVWQRFATIFAGPGTNYAFAVVLAFVLYSVVGVANVTSGYQVTGVHEGFDAYGKLEPGDRIVSVQSARDAQPRPVLLLNKGEAPPESLAALVHNTKGEPLQITVQRSEKAGDATEGQAQSPVGDEGTSGYQELTFTIAARADPSFQWEDTGEDQYRLGISLGSYLIAEEYEDLGIIDAMGQALYYPVVQTMFTLQVLYRVVVGEEEGQLTGPVGIAKHIRQAIDQGWLDALRLVMALSVWLGLFNLLPLPALDGGRLVFLVYEMATRRRANPKIEATIHMVGIMFLLLVLVAVTFKDCANL